MPWRWYALSLALFALIGGGIFLIAWLLPLPGRWAEFIGTMLTLLPVLLDLLRRWYVARTTLEGARSPAAIWAEMRVRRALLGYEPLYGVLVIAGVGLIALGFASEILHG
jgi:uncharacterized membrane protein